MSRLASPRGGEPRFLKSIITSFKYGIRLNFLLTHNANARSSPLHRTTPTSTFFSTTPTATGVPSRNSTRTFPFPHSPSIPLPHPLCPT